MKRNRRQWFRATIVSILIAILIVVFFQNAKGIVERTPMFSDQNIWFTLGSFGFTWIIIYMILLYYYDNSGLPEEIILYQIYYIASEQINVRGRNAVVVIPVSKKHTIIENIHTKGEIVCFLPKVGEYKLTPGCYYVFYPDTNSRNIFNIPIRIKEVKPPTTNKSWYAVS